MKTLYLQKLGLILALFILGVAALLVLANPVSAQEPTATPAAESTEPPASEPDAQTAAPADQPAVPAEQLLPFLKSAEFFRLVRWVLATALIMWGILFFYTAYTNNRYFATSLDFNRRGVTTVPNPLAAHPFIGSGLNVRQLSTKIKLTGPKVVTVGEESEPFELTSTDTAADFSEVTWSVKPTAAAALHPSKGKSIRVIAAVNGAFKLSVSGGEIPKDAEPEPLSVAAIPSQSAKRIELPVFGQGYGTIAIAIVILAIVLILGMATILPSAAIATLLGTLVAHIFSRNTSNASGGGSGSTSTSGGNSNPPVSDE